MGAPQHTPGPWLVGEPSDLPAQRRVIPVGPKDAVAVVPFDLHLREAAQRDAALIAAAPELLSALQGLTGLAKMRGGHLHEYTAAVTDAEAAIAKALGQAKATGGDA